MAEKTKKKRKKKSRYNRGAYVSMKSGVMYTHRSGWELLYMKYLDSNTDVVSWTYEQIVIEYVSNIRTNKIRRYYPDFFVTYSDGHSEVIEVKPKRKLSHTTVIKKSEAALLWCKKNYLTYRIITEDELKAINLL